MDNIYSCMYEKYKDTLSYNAVEQRAIIGNFRRSYLNYKSSSAIADEIGLQKIEKELNRILSLIDNEITKLSSVVSFETPENKKFRREDVDSLYELSYDIMNLQTKITRKKKALAKKNK